jgi:hypothetical protein
MQPPFSFFKPQSRWMRRLSPHSHELTPPEPMLMHSSHLISSRHRHAVMQIARSLLTGRP